MNFSIAIVVRNDRAVKDTLDHLEPIVARRSNFEVVVIDASKPETLADIKSAHPWVYWYYFTNKAGKRFTIPEQRNMAIKKCKGDVVIFLDASCVPAMQWADVMQHAFEKEDLDMVAGMVVSPGDTKTTHDAGYEARTDNAPLEECGAANLAVKKTILREIGGFDTRLSYGEDVDLVWRAQGAGYQVIFKKEAVISHDWGSFKDEMRRAFRYGQSRITLYKKHPHRWRGLFGIDMIAIIYPAYLLLLPLTIWWPWYPLVIIVPLLKNIGKQPFKTTFLHLLYGSGVIKGVFKSM